MDQRFIPEAITSLQVVLLVKHAAQQYKENILEET